MTFSIVGHCPKTDMAGVAITTSSICVGSRCPHVLAGAGAVTTQNVTDPSIGPEALAQLAAGATADTALAAVMADRPHSDYRQVALVDLAGNVAHFTGANILGTNAVTTGIGCIAAGNLLASEAVTAAMVTSFAAGAVYLADRLLTALQVGIVAGGEEGPTRSAALLVAHRKSWRWLICVLTGPRNARVLSCVTCGMPMNRRCRPIICGRWTPLLRQAMALQVMNNV